MLNRRLLSSAAPLLPLIAVGVLAGAAQASPLNISTATGSGFGRSSVVAATSTPTAATGTMQSSSQDLVGIVKSINGNQLEIKLPDGQTQPYSAPSGLSTNTLTPGSFVQVTLDANNVIQDVKIPSVEKVLSGVISNIDGDQVTLELADGTKETTTINEATTQRMNLSPGVPLTVTSYTGLTATKLCPTLLATCCQKPAPPVPVAPLPAVNPIGGGERRPDPKPQRW